MAELQKHYGIIKSTGSRCIVVFRELVNEDGSPNTEQCLIVNADALPTMYSDAVASFVRSKSAQSSNNLFESMNAMGTMPSGENMLNALHTSGKLRPWSVDDVEMQVTPRYNIPLRELNEQIRAIESGTQDEIKPNDFNPFDHLNNHVEDEQKEGIAWNLVQDAQEMQRVADEKLARAYDLNPKLKPEVQEETTVVESESKSETEFSIDIANMTQAKAVQALKDFMKANKGKK